MDKNPKHPGLIGKIPAGIWGTLTVDACFRDAHSFKLRTHSNPLCIKSGHFHQPKDFAFVASSRSQAAVLRGWQRNASKERVSFTSSN